MNIHTCIYMHVFVHVYTYVFIFIYIHLYVCIIRTNRNCIKSAYRSPTSKIICRSLNPNESMARYPGLNRFFTPQNLKMHADESIPRAFSEESSGIRALDRTASTKYKMDWKSLKKTLQRMRSVKCDGCRSYLACVCVCVCVFVCVCVCVRVYVCV